MPGPLVPDELWEVVQPLLPRHRARPGKRGRPPVDDRACLTGIIFVLQSGIPWEMLPQEMGCGSGMTCWRRLRYWQRRGVWKKLLHALLQRVGQEEGIDWEHCCVDSQTFALFLGGPDRQKPHGSREKRHQTAPVGRWQGHATGRADHCGQPQRVARSDELGGRHSADPRAARSAARRNRRRCTGTASTARHGIGKASSSDASRTTWRARGHPMAAAWARSARWSSGPWRGSGKPVG